LRQDLVAAQTRVQDLEAANGQVEQLRQDLVAAQTRVQDLEAVNGELDRSLTEEKGKSSRLSRELEESKKPTRTSGLIRAFCSGFVC